MYIAAEEFFDLTPGRHIKGPATPIEGGLAP